MLFVLLFAVVFVVIGVIRVGGVLQLLLFRVVVDALHLLLFRVVDDALQLFLFLVVDVTQLSLLRVVDVTQLFLLRVVVLQLFLWRDVDVPQLFLLRVGWRFLKNQSFGEICNLCTKNEKKRKVILKTKLEFALSATIAVLCGLCAVVGM